MATARSMKLTKDVLTTATAELLGGNVAEMPQDRLYHLIKVTQHATDLLLNEIERRGEPGSQGDAPIVLHASDFGCTVSSNGRAARSGTGSAPQARTRWWSQPCPACSRTPATTAPTC
jgi:hypothetical protein